MLLMPNGFDAAIFRPDPVSRGQVRAELGLTDDHTAVIRVARDDPNKDLPTFLAAVKIAAPRQPHARFFLVGQGMDPGNPALAECLEPPLKGVVRLLGRRDDVPRLLTGMDLFVQSSVSEGLPGALGEAMAARLVCVATRVGDSREMLGDAGFLVEPGQPLALAEAMIDALALPEEERIRRGIETRVRIQDGYSLRAMVQAHAELYQKVLGRG
jgi:glycosyltransferase involved in cell wall biosynthesis